MKHRNLIGAIALFMLVLFLGLSLVFAGDPARIGTAAGEQLLVPVGARSLALGGSNVAYTKGLDALYWNPAGLSQLRTMEATVMGATLFADTKYKHKYRPFWERYREAYLRVEEERRAAKAASS